MKRVEGINNALTGKDQFKWFVLHAEAESGVVQGFHTQGAILPGAPEAVCSSSCMTLAAVRAHSKLSYNSIDDVEEEELVGTYMCGFGQGVNEDNHIYLATDEYIDWYSKRKVRLPINSGLFLGI